MNLSLSRATKGTARAGRAKSFLQRLTLLAVGALMAPGAVPAFAAEPAAAGHSANATTWSMPGDFDSLGKSDSAWSAGRADILDSSSFRAFTDSQDDGQWRMRNFGDVDLWENGLVWFATKTAFGFEAGEMVIHPGNSPDKATAIRWTAPAAAENTTYHVTGSFRVPADSGDRDFVIRLGDEILFEARGSTAAQDFDFEFTASAGRMLDFVIGCGNTWTNEGAGFAVTISEKKGAND